MHARSGCLHPSGPLLIIARLHVVLEGREHDVDGLADDLRSGRSRGLLGIVQLSMSLLELDSMLPCSAAA